jgi:arylsulfatase A-like enzyme
MQVYAVRMLQDRRTFLASLGGAALIQRPAPSNIVVLFTDDHRFDMLSGLGHRDVKTPNLDRLMRCGVTFTHACTQGGPHGAVCVATRAQLMTGRSVFRANEFVMSRKEGPDPAVKTFPELLRAAGYETHGIGKWHNQPALYQRSFSSGGPIFFGGMSDHDKVPVQAYDPEGRYGKDRIEIAKGFSSELFVSAAVDFINGRGREAKPYLLYTAFTSPHDPRMAPGRFADMYDPARVEMPPNFMASHPFDNGEMKVRDEMLAAHPRTEAEVRKHIAAYYGMVSEVDHQIGRIIDAVDRSPGGKNTYIVMAGDNGLAVGQHGLLGKQNLYDHSWRVPMIVSSPWVEGGRRCDSMCHIMDLCPTICRFAGIAPPAGIEAQGLNLALKNEKTVVRESIVAQYKDCQRALRSDEWKLILYNVNGVKTAQLFNVEKDPWEMINLAEKQPKLVAKLKSELQGQLTAMGDRTILDAPKWVV